MTRIFTCALISIALLANASAQTSKSRTSKSKDAPPQTGKSKIECTASGVTTVVEIDYGTKLVRTWNKLDNGADGPARRSSANIGRDKITWLIVKSVGSASSRTRYALDTKTRTLSVAPDSGRHFEAPCAAT